MRVNFVLHVDSLAGGTRVVATYAEQLRRRGHQVMVVSVPFPRVPLRRRIKSLFMGRGWPTFKRGPSYFDGLDVDYRVLDTFRPVRDGDLPDADVVVATYWATAEWVANLSASKGAKAYLIQDLESTFEGHPADRVEATWNLPMQKIVISKWLENVARERFGDSGSILLPNAVDVNLFHAPRRGKQPRPTVGILYAPISPRKGTKTALAVIEQVSRRIPGLHVRAFGTGKLSRSAPLPPGSDYTQKPPQHVLREIYAACDVWLCTSTSEGWGLPPQEAMACRCPVVSTKVPGPLAIVQEGVNGFLLNVDDVSGLASRVIEVLELPEPDWQRMSEAAYERVRYYTWEEATIMFERALDVAIERFGSGVLEH